MYMLYILFVFYLYDPSLVCCEALRSNKVDVDVLSGFGTRKNRKCT